jgi:iron complex transport system permease protein
MIGLFFIFVFMLSKRFILLIIILLISCILLFIVNLLTGFENITLYDLFFTQEETKNLIISYRFNRASAVVLAGISLPVSGFLLQELFKNPLAEPSVLGITSASALAVALVIFSGGGVILLNYQWLGGWLLIISSFIGALLTSLLLLFIAKGIKNISTFIIIGFLLSSFSGSLISTLQFYSQSESLKQYVYWSFGSFEGLSGKQILAFAICTVTGLVPAFISVKKLIGFLMGEEYAKVLGVNMTKLKVNILIAVCLLTGSTTAMLGPIVFIGIIIPHFCRQIWNPSALWIQINLNILIGSLFLLLISLIMSYTQLPVNILSSLIGVPTILFIIFKDRNKN